MGYQALMILLFCSFSVQLDQTTPFNPNLYLLPFAIVVGICFVLMLIFMVSMVFWLKLRTASQRMNTLASLSNLPSDSHRLAGGWFREREPLSVLLCGSVLSEKPCLMTVYCYIYFSYSVVLDHHMYPNWNPMQYLWPFATVAGVCLLVLVVFGVSLMWHDLSSYQPATRLHHCGVNILRCVLLTVGAGNIWSTTVV